MLIFKDTTIFLGYEKYDLLTTCVTAITAVSLYILLIPTYGAIGASLATIVSYLLDLILKAVFLERILPKLNDNKPDTISNINQSL